MGMSPMISALSELHYANSIYTSAYTAVPTNRSLGGHAYGSQLSPPPTAPPAQPVPGKKVDWPPAVRDYVQRCFAADNKIAGISTEEMQKRLKVVINESANSNTLHAIDWANLPLPQELIQRERAAQLGVYASSPVRSSLSSISLHEPASPTNKASTKKRKSGEMEKTSDTNTESNLPPWRKTNGHNAFEDRVTYTNDKQDKQTKRAEKRQKKAQEVQQQFNAQDASKSVVELEKRRQRFDLGPNKRDSPGFHSSREDTPLEASPGPVVGTCQSLEKKYLRLTAAPKPETVRPQHVLEKTFDLLKSKWKQDKNYHYICDQLKSMRQDLTVQHIKNEFTVNVYELHARIALEKGDLGEYNQCQSQLRALYKQKLGGHPEEFLAYRILYLIYTCNRTDMNDVFADLSMASRSDPSVQHALQVRSALALGNYHRFFELFSSTPLLGGYLIDRFVDRERLAAIATICRAYSAVPLRFVTDELGFESDKEAAAFICDRGGDSFLDDSKGEEIIFKAKDAINVFETARSAAFRSVDIKGQI